MIANFCISRLARRLKELGLIASVAFLAITPAQAQSQGLNLELNYTEDLQNGCRMTFLVSNSTSISFKSFAYEFVVLNDKGQAVEFAKLEFGAVAPNKLKAYRFDLEGRSCKQISQLLINDTLACETTRGTSPVCTQALNATSRVSTITLQ